MMNSGYIIESINVLQLSPLCLERFIYLIN